MHNLQIMLHDNSNLIKKFMRSHLKKIEIPKCSCKSNSLVYYDKKKLLKVVARIKSVVS